MSLLEPFLEELYKKKIVLTVNHGKLKLRSPDNVLTDEILNKIKAHKAEIILFLEEYGKAATDMASVNHVEKIEREDRTAFQSSFDQQRLWFIDQLQEGSAEYNMPLALRIEGVFDIDAAELAVQRIIYRHESLRTVYKAQGEKIMQVIQSKFKFRLIRHDLSHLDEATQQSKVQTMIEKDRLKSFNLSHDLMVRVSYIQLSSEQGVLLFNMHHIASDGWSMGILVKEFVAQYQSAKLGENDPLTPLAIQYVDYAYWQRKWLLDDVLKGQLNYWIKHLDDIPSVHSVPLDYPRPKMKSYQGGVVSTQLDGKLSQRLQQIAKDHQLTPFMLLHAGLALLLSRHSNHDDIVVGTPIANRMQAELEPLIGFFTNTIVLRTNVKHKKLSDYLAYIKTIHLEAQAHQDIPFEQLVEHCKVPHSNTHTPLFQIMFTINTNEQSDLSIPGVSFKPITSKDVIAKFDLDISAKLSPQGVYFSWTYDKSIFTREHIERLAVHLNNLMTGIAKAPNSKLKDLPMLSTQEVQRLTFELNGPQKDYSSFNFTHELFEMHAQQAPNKLAIVFKNVEITYKELNELSNQLAHYLLAKKVRTETLVGICIERGLEMIVSILAVLKVGATYVPLDPGYPKARIEFILKDTNLNHLLTLSNLTEKFVIDENVQITNLDSVGLVKRLSEYPRFNLEKLEKKQKNTLVYVIYTSGSTGQPKGVMIDQQALLNFLLAMNDKLSGVFEAPYKLLAVTTLAFDIAGLELLGPLSHGGQIVLASSEDSLDPERLSYLLEQHNIQIMQATPATWELMVRAGWPGQKELVILSGGEALSSKLAHSLLPKCRQLWNCYGPTEATIWSMVKKIETDDLLQASTLLGGALNNYSHYVLNDHHQLTPLGGVGELHIGGLSLAKGYFNKPELTKERFIRNTFTANSQEQLYKTGDLVRYMADGKIEFIGRLDDQIKIRGFRVELGEIESQLSKIEEVLSCLVMAREDEPGNKRLVAYMVTDNSGDLNKQDLLIQIKNQLENYLPIYMVPREFVFLDELPLTPNGKVDKKSLPMPDGTVAHGKYIEPKTDTEIALIKIWAQLLTLKSNEISADANFFELGGHSLLVIRLVADVNNLFGLKAYSFRIKDAFLQSSVNSMSLEIENKTMKERNEQARKKINNLECVEEGEI